MPSESVIRVTGQPVPGLESFDRLMVSVMAEHGVPGAALAVTRNSRLVYARGFGLADRGRRQAVQPTALFRIASVSKPLTAVAVLQLVERGELKPSDKVFDVLKFKPHLEKGAKPDPRLADVTVLHCLRHAGGWDRGKAFDPMFRSVRIARALGVEPPAEPRQIIRFMMGQPLQFDPGTGYAYSNFGYSLLARVIEVVSGQPYEQYVCEHALKPIGIKDMRIGKTLLSGRAPNEVRYYAHKGGRGPAVLGDRLGKSVPRPYGAFYVEGFDAHGGWLASAPDLVRFAAEFDRPERCKLLNAKSIRLMHARPDGPLGHEPDGKPKAAFYACGWLVRPRRTRFNAWHAGGLPGTSTLLVRRHDGLDWAVLFNADRGPKSPQTLADLIDPLVHRAANAVKKWPRTDGFVELYGKAP